MKSFLEAEDPDKDQIETTQHFMDFCLDCRACETACPSNVNYSELASITRHRLDALQMRRQMDRIFRWAILTLLTNPVLLRILLPLARRLRPLYRILPAKLAKLVRTIPQTPPTFSTGPLRNPAGKAKGHLLLFHGCVGSVARPSIELSSRAVLEHLGYSVQTVPARDCCGSLADHSGFASRGDDQSARLQERFARDASKHPDALIYTISGCGKKIRSLSPFPTWEFAQFIGKSELHPEPFILETWRKKRIVWHTPCSLRHGIKAITDIEALWKMWNITLIQPAESSICCGSAGSYSMLQPSMSEHLAERKTATIDSLNPDIVITHNIGCLEQLRDRISCPILMVEEMIAILYGCIQYEAIALQNPKQKRAA